MLVMFEAMGFLFSVFLVKTIATEIKTVGKMKVPIPELAGMS